MRITLRLPEDLHKWLVRHAATYQRSLNAEIVYALRLYMQREQARQEDAKKRET